jgi:hypothetical protein
MAGRDAAGGEKTLIFLPHPMFSESVAMAAEIYCSNGNGNCAAPLMSRGRAPGSPCRGTP